MKRYFKLLIAMLGAVSFAACTETVTMDKSVDVRVDDAIQAYTKILTTADYGWMLDVMTKEGVYRFWVEFSDDNKVVMYTDNLHYPELNGVPRESTYNIRALQRPTLSFDTYNYISIINDPSNEISFGANNMGLETDFEFEFVTYDEAAGEFELQGRVNKVYARLVKAIEEEAAAAAEGGLQDVLAISTSYNNGMLNRVEINGIDCDVQFSARSVSVTYLDEDEEAVLRTAYTYTNYEGSVFCVTPLYVEGVEVEGFLYDGATYYAVTEEGEESEVTAAETPQVALHYLFGYQNVYTRIHAELGMYTNPSNPFYGYMQNSNYKLTDTGGGEHLFAGVNIYFDRAESGNIVMLMAAVFGRFTGTVSFPMTYNEERDEITIGNKYEAEDGNGDYFFAQIPGLKSMATALLGKTVRIEWSPVKYPGYNMGQLVLTNNPNAAFIGGML